MSLTDQKSKFEKPKVHIIRLLRYIYEKNSVCFDLSVHLLEIYLEENLEGWNYLEVNLEGWIYLEVILEGWIYLEVNLEGWIYLEVKLEGWKYLEVNLEGLERSRSKPGRAGTI